MVEEEDLEEVKADLKDLRKKVEHMATDMVSLGYQGVQLASLVTKMDVLTQSFHTFLVENAKAMQQFADSTKAAHRRLDDHESGHKERRGWFMTLIVGVITSLIASLWAWIRSMGGGKP